MTDELFAMTDMLQSADGHDDATAVLMTTSQRLLPNFGIALYIFNNSRDRLDLTGSWNHPEGFTPADTLNPGNCWALKRGKFHINDPQSTTLCCAHHSHQLSSIEIPMMARGNVYGLLVLSLQASDAFQRLRDVQRLGRALADSMSLALSNISLREKLRTQSLRDPLTGLYNRRYMEDALERYISLAQRTGSPIAVIMIDLDNFKALNDEHGHARSCAKWQHSSLAGCDHVTWSADMGVKNWSRSSPTATWMMRDCAPKRCARGWKRWPKSTVRPFPRRLVWPLFRTRRRPMPISSPWQTLPFMPRSNKVATEWYVRQSALDETNSSLGLR